MVLLCRVRRYCYAMAIAAILVGTSLLPANAQQAAARAASASTSVFDIAQTGIEFQTGDTWSQNGQTFRLFGVQACVRGTQFTNPAGVKRRSPISPRSSETPSRAAPPSRRPEHRP